MFEAATRHDRSTNRVRVVWDDFVKKETPSESESTAARERSQAEKSIDIRPSKRGVEKNQAFTLATIPCHLTQEAI